ncbi:MAG: T9SS type A sorting domain-containing protein [bacterium]
MLKVYDLIGREIQTLVREYVDAGTHSVKFDARILASGLYFYKLQTGDFVETKRMLLIR